MRRAIVLLLSLSVIGIWACDSDRAPQLPGGAVAGVAPPPFDAMAFEGITWASQAETLEHGQAVFEANCQKCHGVTGAGEGGYIFGGQSLQPPSWIVADWRLADDPVALRSYIYSGSVGGMPYWGLTGVSYRDIDAVADYIVYVLRPTYGESESGG